VNFFSKTFRPTVGPTHGTGATSFETGKHSKTLRQSQKTWTSIDQTSSTVRNVDWNKASGVAVSHNLLPDPSSRSYAAWSNSVPSFRRKVLFAHYVTDTFLPPNTSVYTKPDYVTLQMEAVSSSETPTQTFTVVWKKNPNDIIWSAAVRTWSMHLNTRKYGTAPEPRFSDCQQIDITNRYGGHKVIKLHHLTW
jgi:hypothetical protein